MKPAFSRAYFNQLLKETNTPLNTAVADVLFNDKDSKKVNLDLSKGLLEGSAVNFYGEGVTADEADRFYANMRSPDPKRPLSTGLNSKLVKENGKLKEKVWKSEIGRASCRERV